MKHSKHPNHHEIIKPLTSPLPIVDAPAGGERVAYGAVYDSPILTRHEAMVLAGYQSNAFYRWLQRHGITPCRRGRYSKASILAALERECGHPVTLSAQAVRPLPPAPKTHQRHRAPEVPPKPQPATYKHPHPPRVRDEID